MGVPENFDPKKGGSSKNSTWKRGVLEYFCGPPSFASVLHLINERSPTPVGIIEQSSL